MKTLYIKDKNRRISYSFLEKKKLILTHIIHNLTLSLNIRQFAQTELHNLLQKNSHTKIKNRCVLTNRSRGVYRQTKISRLFFKKYALCGMLTGIKKASW